MGMTNNIKTSILPRIAWQNIDFSGLFLIDKSNLFNYIIDAITGDFIEEFLQKSVSGRNPGFF